MSSLRYCNAQAGGNIGARTCAAGKLGPKGSSARVIYGQTDSVFVHLPDCTAAEAVTLGQQIGSLASQAFPPEMKLAFEKVRVPASALGVDALHRCCAL